MSCVISKIFNITEVEMINAKIGVGCGSISIQLVGGIEYSVPQRRCSILLNGWGVLYKGGARNNG